MMTRIHAIAALFSGLATLILISSTAHSDVTKAAPLTRSVHSVKVERVPGKPGLVRITAITVANSTGYSGARLIRIPDRNVRTGKVVLQLHLNKPKGKYVGWAMVRHTAVVVIRVPKGTKTIQVDSQTNQITAQIPAG